MPGVDDAASITTCVDNSGNSITAGYYRNTVDFNVLGGGYPLTTNGNNEIFIRKDEPNGNFIWAKSIGGSGDEYPYNISADNSGNVLVTGRFTGTVDFDPNASVYNLTSNGGLDIFILKLDPSGNLLWAKNLGSSSSEYWESIEADQIGNVYVTGNFSGTTDFDPGAGIMNQTSDWGWNIPMKYS